VHSFFVSTSFSAGTISTLLAPLRGTRTAWLRWCFQSCVSNTSRESGAGVRCRRGAILLIPDVNRTVRSWRRWCSSSRDPAGTPAGPRAATSAVHMAPLLEADMVAPRGRLGHIRSGAGHQHVPQNRARALAGPNTRHQKLFSRSVHRPRFTYVSVFTRCHNLAAGAKYRAAPSTRPGGTTPPPLSAVPVALMLARFHCCVSTSREGQARPQPPS